MRQAEIHVGGHYECRVSGKIVAVRVARRVERITSRGQNRTKFLVRRLDNGRKLPKPRSAASFRREIKPPRTSENEKRLDEAAAYARKAILDGEAVQAGLFAQMAAGYGNRLLTGHRFSESETRRRTTA